MDKDEDATQQGRFAVFIDWTTVNLAMFAASDGTGMAEGEDGGKNALNYWAYLSSRHDLMVNNDKKLVLYVKLKDGKALALQQIFFYS